MNTPLQALQHIFVTMPAGRTSVPANVHAQPVYMHRHRILIQGCHSTYWQPNLSCMHHTPEMSHCINLFLCDVLASLVLFKISFLSIMPSRSDSQHSIPNTVHHSAPEVQPVDPPGQPAPILLLCGHKHTCSQS